MTGLTAFAGGVWLGSEPIVHLGLRLTATMTVIRLADGGLLLHSPVLMTAARRDALAELGPITHLYAPNLYHHTWIGAWASAYPSARVHAPAGLAGKRGDLRIDRVHGPGAAPEPAFAGVAQELPIAGFALAETALLVGPARTLVVADLVHNIGRPAHGWTRLYAKLMGFHDRVALSRMLRLAAFPDRDAARRSLDEVLARPFDRLVSGHGAPIVADAHRALAEAYAWLPAKR